VVKQIKKENTMNENYFKKLNSINVNEHKEKKGRFDYLSWSYAVGELKKLYPSARWEVKRFGESQLPFQKTDCGYFVEVEVEVEGIKQSHIHPVLDNYNKPIVKPNAFQINTSIQRCLVKAIAMHGLGLYIYAGEDLPDIAESNEEFKDGLAMAKHDLGIDEEAQKNSYKTYLEALELQTAETIDDFLKEAREEAKNLKWSTYQNEAFGKKVEKVKDNLQIK
jgi:hypothetical protein